MPGLSECTSEDITLMDVSTGGHVDMDNIENLASYMPKHQSGKGSTTGSISQLSANEDTVVMIQNYVTDTSWNVSSDAMNELGPGTVSGDSSHVSKNEQRGKEDQVIPVSESVQGNSVQMTSETETSAGRSSLYEEEQGVMIQTDTQPKMKLQMIVRQEMVEGQIGNSFETEISINELGESSDDQSTWIVASCAEENGQCADDCGMDEVTGQRHLVNEDPSVYDSVNENFGQPTESGGVMQKSTGVQSQGRSTSCAEDNEQRVDDSGMGEITGQGQLVNKGPSVEYSVNVNNRQPVENGAVRQGSSGVNQWSLASHHHFQQPACLLGEQDPEQVSGLDVFPAERDGQVTVRGPDTENFTDFMSAVVKTECVTDDPENPYGGQGQLVYISCPTDQIKQELEDVVPTTASVEPEAEILSKKRQGRKPKVKLAFPCLICGCRHSTSATLRSHMNTHSEEMLHEPETVDPSVTPPMTTAADSAVKEGKGYKSKVKLTFACDICKCKFSTSAGLRSHMKTHTHEKHYICDVCQMSFVSFHQLKKHKKSHGAQNSKSLSGKLVRTKSKSKSAKGKHKCQKCPKPFQTPEMLKKHMMKLHKQNSFECDSCRKNYKTSTRFDKHACRTSVYFECGVCEQNFNNREELKKHVGNHPDVPEELKYECGVCEMVFRKPRSLKLHMKVHNRKGKNYLCTECDKSFFYHKSLLNHQEAAHKDEYNCRICSKEFSKHSLLRKHMGSHMERFPCEECNEMFTKAADLRLHSRIHRKWKCRKCDVEFRTRVELKSHRLVHRKRYKCVACEFSSCTSVSLHEHMTMHCDQASYKCQVCDESFPRITSLYQHSFTHTNMRRYTCELCGSSFTQSSTLMTHMRVHTGERPFPCLVCEKAFVEKSALRSHMISHSTEKKHQCDICGKSFPHKCSLVRHIRIHTLNKPFKCWQCDKSFGQSNQLKIHLRSHTGEKPFKCEECGLRYTYPETLRSHMRIHGVADITCDQCDKTFSNKFHFKRHYQLHTGEVNFVCDVCGQGFGRKDYLQKHILAHGSELDA